MKTLGLALALFVPLCGASHANTLEATVDTYTTWTLMAAPLVPLDPAIDSVFTGYDMWFTGGLTRWEAPDQGMIGYCPFDPNDPFGKILIGDGYWLQYPTGGQIRYIGVMDGVPDSSGDMADMWITLPGGQGPEGDKGGWHLIGQPFFHDTPVEDPNDPYMGAHIKFTDGVRMLKWAEAAEESYGYNWVDSAVTYWNAVFQGMEAMGYFFNTDDHFRYGHGYWLYTKKDNLTMIIPAYPAENQPYP